MAGSKTIKSAIESMMFVWGDPLDIKEVADIFNVDKREIYDLCKELQAEYEQEGRGIVIREVNKCFQFVTRPENIGYIERLCTPVKHKRLSQSALEVLAIIAYKQPVTKGEIEAVRGIKCDRVIEGLMKKELVAQLGRSDAVGRPMLYGTTDQFLMEFGFETLKDLPEIEDIEGVLDESDADSDDILYTEQIAIELPSGE
ncbi:MAG: SMC-Scp complex subunit ScpB [Clostridiales bacterium]|nr:SMC-Scp complex subunit ScpB [Clostridiales bacterium]MDD7016887.1 SMC-Scp complex subunit ScpB [Bacillota bacterium]